MKKLNILCCLLVTSCWLLVAVSFAQNVFSSEEDLKKQANKLFEEEDFAKAYPLFSQLLSLYPKDPQYNYKFGTCLLFASNDKEKAIPYIEFAAKRQKQDVDKEVFFYLGKAYHLNYRFGDAINAYNNYKNIASAKQAEKYDVNRQMEMCENGKRLLKNITDLSVLEKKEVSVKDFFRSYNLSEFNAKLIIKPDDLKSSLDKKKKDESLMYLSPDRNQIYYSSFGEDGKTGRDIYYVTRTANGDLSKPTRADNVINTMYDEDYAFLHPNGRALYFCSKGHNSMGGYDIFKSEWNSGTQSWGKPINMDFAINTPDDDILFISDSEDKSAYFSSRRESAEGNITVYKIKLDRKPLDLAIITGTLTKDVGDKMAKATITVTKILKDEVIGVFNTNAADGSYTLRLPNGGKFMFSIESAGFKKSSELVVVPNQQEIKPMKQEITLVNENGQDKIIIKNEFDAQVDSADLQLAAQYIKAKASLEISSAEEEITSVAVEENNPITSPETKTERKNAAPVTNTDIIEMAYQDAKETQKEANELRKNSDAAQQLASQKNNLSIQKYKEAQELMKSAEAITNQEEKIAQMDKSAALRKESETLSKESALALTLSNQMDDQANAKQQQADAELKYAKDIDNAIKSAASEKKMNELLAQKEELDKKSESLKTSATISDDMNKQAENQQEEASKSMAKYIDIQQDIEDLQSEAKRLRSEAEKTKNDGVKQNLNQQAEEMEKEAEMKKKDAEIYNASAKQLQSKADSLKNSASLTTSVMQQIQSSQGTTTLSSELPSNTSITSIAVNETTATTTDNKTNSTSINPVIAPPAMTSPYVDVFVNQMQEAENKTNALEKEQALSAIYQSWTDSLDHQIISLNKQLASTTKEEHKTQIQTKISELQSSADDKRQKAATSRNKADNLKLQEALAAASNVSAETTAVTTTTNTESSTANTPSTENITGTKNINIYYENKLKANETISNEYEKKVKEQEIYNDWSSSLYDESQRLKKEGNNSNAEEAVNESKAKQTLALQTANQVTQIKAEHPELVASANLTVTETTSPVTSSYETKNESTTPPSTEISSQTTTVSTHTATATNPTETTTQAANNNVTSATKIESTTQPINNSILSASVPESVKNKDEYTHYVALKNEADWSKKNAERQYKQAEDAQKIADEQFSESQNISQQSATVTDPNERLKLQEKSDNLDKQALRNQAKADSIKKVAMNSEAEASSKATESELYLQSLDKSAYEEITAATATTRTETKTEPTTQPVTGTNTLTTTETANTTNPVTTQSGTSNTVTAAETTSVTTKTTQPENNTTISGSTATTPEPATTTSVIPKVTTPPVTASSAELIKYYDALFDKIDFTGSSYSSSKPIPIDPPMPDGLVFKVQIGAFRNPIPQNLFKGLKPITAETTPQGLKRYTAGLFQKFTTANDAKMQVNGLGYRDAFVVAFFNGKRISMTEALEKAKDAGENINPASFSSSSAAIPSSSASTSIPLESGTNIANATDVKSVNGLFYTIQIGVFSKPVTSTQLYNIAPLNSEKTDNGLIRYTTGRFSDETKAMQSKNNIAQKGIADAFVVAYYNGKRISLSSAKSMIDSGGGNIVAQDKQEYSFVPSDTTTSESSATSLSASSNKGITFKVQVGAYREQVPIEDANKLLQISSKGIKTFRDENGMLIYTVGDFLEYESANNLKTQLINQGLGGAFVIAFKDGKKISAADALDLIKNK